MGKKKASTEPAQMSTTMVGGNMMYQAQNIIENAVNSKDHTTLVAAVSAAGLVETLKGAGPFTVLAPTNDAFENLPAGTVETLLKPENKATLTKILTYHVIAGRMTSRDLRRKIKEGKGIAQIKTVSGGFLTFKTNGDNLMVTDENGASANLTILNVMQSNGVIHVLDAVVTPR
jgi:uncharacterized surface protein with fasciclin (FAS1) repeats